MQSIQKKKKKPGEFYFRNRTMEKLCWCKNVVYLECECECVVRGIKFATTAPLATILFHDSAESRSFVRSFTHSTWALAPSFLVPRSSFLFTLHPSPFNVPTREWKGNMAKLFLFLSLYSRVRTRRCLVYMPRVSTLTWSLVSSPESFRSLKSTPSWKLGFSSLYTEKKQKNRGVHSYVCKHYTYIPVAATYIQYRGYVSKSLDIYANVSYTRGKPPLPLDRYITKHDKSILRL